MSRSHTDVLTLRCRHLLPMGGPAIEGGWLRIERGRIAGMGRGSPPAPCRDAGDAIIVPGLVNAHTHLEFSDLDAPLAATGGLPDWIERVVTLRRGRGPGEHSRVRGAVARGLAESAAAGVTTVGEIATAAPLAAYAAGGPRVRVFREGLGLSGRAVRTTTGRIAAEIGRSTGGPLLGGISPHAPYSVAAPLGRHLVAAAHRHRLPIAMHIAESGDEAAFVATGAGPFRRLLDALGAWPPEGSPRLLSAADWITLIARAPRGVVVHGTFLPDDMNAMARLTRHRDRLAVAICPRTTRALSGRLPPVRAFRDAGIRVALGTDSRASNPDLAVLAECRLLVDASLASPEEALLMATRHGAWSLMLERRCGLLAPGRPADLAILRPPGTYGDPFTAALHPATQVVATMRSGRWIHGGV